MDQSASAARTADVHATEKEAVAVRAFSLTLRDTVRAVSGIGSLGAHGTLEPLDDALMRDGTIEGHTAAHERSLDSLEARGDMGGTAISGCGITHAQS